jgi:hypothetical protein
MADYEPHEDIESFQANGTFSGNMRGEQLASIGAVFGLRHDGVMIVENLMPGGAAEKSGTVEIGTTMFQLLTDPLLLKLLYYRRYSSPSRWCRCHKESLESGHL